MNTTPIGSLTSYRWIVINHSGGKDSMASMLTVLRECRADGVDRRRIVLSHQCLGAMEWQGTADLVREHADQLGLRVEISSYRDKEGKSPTLLDYVRKRRMWPRSSTRFCTSEFKRGPGGRVITRLYQEAPGPVLNVYGFRVEESPARAKKKVFVKNARFSTASRTVMDWLPIHDMKTAEIGHDFKYGQPIKEILAALHAGETAGPADDKWNM